MNKTSIGIVLLFASQLSVVGCTRQPATPATRETPQVVTPMNIQRVDGEDVPSKETPAETP